MKHFLLSVAVLALAKLTTFGREFFIASEIGFSTEWDHALIIIATVGVAIDAFVYYCNAHRFNLILNGSIPEKATVKEIFGTLLLLNTVLGAVFYSGLLQLGGFVEIILANALCFALMQTELSRIRAISRSLPQLVSTSTLLAAISSICMLLVFDVNDAKGILAVFIGQGLVNAIAVNARLKRVSRVDSLAFKNVGGAALESRASTLKMVSESLIVAAIGQGQRYIERILLLSLYVGALSSTHLVSTVSASIISIITVTIINFTMRATFINPKGPVWFLSAIINSSFLMIVFGLLIGGYEVALVVTSLSDFIDSRDINMSNIKIIYALVVAIAIFETTNAIVKRVAWANAKSMELALASFTVFLLYIVCVFGMTSFGSIATIMLATIAYQFSLLCSNLLVLLKFNVIARSHAALLLLTISCNALAWILSVVNLMGAIIIAAFTAFFVVIIITKMRKQIIV